MENVMNKLTYDDLKEVFDGEKNLTDKPIFIDFYADWWGPCRLFNSVLDEVESDYDGKVNMYKVDIEKEPEVAVMFGARSIPYMVFITDDGKATPEVGAMTTDQLKYRLDGLTQK